ncbi:hypothetical protein WMY93_025143 [Mugilogobius chulae]|uniref:Transglutaminase N-terminal domain-containing protein n=1 Tax=Mugilogobius chulae TaxID=88201 RepID=A0AAW0N2L7_9GOBI
MPVESRLHGSTTAVGRFPTVGFGDEPDGRANVEEEEEKEEDVPEENACRRWLRKIGFISKSAEDDDLNETVVTDSEPKQPEPEDNNELDALVLRVTSIDLLKDKSGQNRTEHRTQDYQSKNLIIRRGQTFQMWITLSRPFDHSTDKLHLELKIG